MKRIHRKPVEVLRVPFNCNIAPTTKELITDIQNETRESQGEVVDRAVALLALGEESPLRVEKKTRRKDRAVQERAQGDITAQLMGRADIDYSDVDSTPMTHVGTLDVAGPEAAGGNGKISMRQWRAGRKPLLKPKEQ